MSVVHIFLAETDGFCSILPFFCPLAKCKVRAIYCTTLLQAFLEHGIPESPEMVVASMQKVHSISIKCLKESI